LVGRHPMLILSPFKGMDLSMDRQGSRTASAACFSVNKVSGVQSQITPRLFCMRKTDRDQENGEPLRNTHVQAGVSNARGGARRADHVSVGDFRRCQSPREGIVAFASCIHLNRARVHAVARNSLWPWLEQRSIESEMALFIDRTECSG